MQPLKSLDKNIQFLITVNYQRMVSFEQAAYLTTEPSFKEFYLSKAEESEINMKQLQLMLDAASPESAFNPTLQSINAETYMPHFLQGKKSSIKILEAIKIAEKSIAQWYKNTLKDIKDLPGEVITLVQDQYKSLNNSKLQLETL